MMERIHVSVRPSPISREAAKKSPWKISCRDSISMPNISFKFDRIFSEDCKTVQVYEARTKDIVSAAVRGFNGTVFAYGQTNSGKTHTMRGSPSEPGLIPLAVHDLFHTISQDASREFLVRMSYLEIYNEDINDLLAPQHRKLQIHENPEKGIFVAGLREEIVASPQQVLQIMEFGESHRHIGKTNMNVHSSRSHTIFRMIIESSQKTQDEGVGNACDDPVRVSVLNLVDLAGSERASKTGAEGVRLKEGSHINKSLMTLGTVIKKLSEGVENQGGHIPYRDSKLTRILQPALGGNANTAIICTITLAPIHADETKSSLQFASRALRVTNCAHVNEILTDAALLKRQKKEIEELRSKPKTFHSDHSDKEILNLRNTLLKSELEREQIALKLEEEKKAQAEREKVLQEQAKKIENLSSMVLFPNRDEKREQVHFKKVFSRRDTWCTGRDSTSEVQSHVGSSLKSERSERETGPLLPFVKNKVLYSISEEDESSIHETLEDSALPDPCALVHVTRRKKPSSIRQKNPVVVVESESDRIQRKDEDLFLQCETERTTNEIQIECLKAKLSENDLCGESELDKIQREYEDLFLQYESQRITNEIQIECLKAKLGENDLCGESELDIIQRDYEDLFLQYESQRITNEIQIECLKAKLSENDLCGESESDRIQREYEDIFLQYESQRITNEIQIECLKAKLGENDLRGEATCKHLDESSVHLRDPEDILLIKQLQEKINMLETEKSSSKQNVYDLITEATEQTIYAREKIAEIQEEIHLAREEAQIAREQLVSKDSEVNHAIATAKEVRTEVEVLAAEFQNFKASLETISSVMDEGLQLFSSLVDDLTLTMRQSLEQHASLISRNYQDLKQKVLDTKNKILSEESKTGGSNLLFNLRGRVLWTREEEEMLRLGVETCGKQIRKNMPWKKILEMGKNVFHQTRSPTDLKDKWRNMNPKKK